MDEIAPNLTVFSSRRSCHARVGLDWGRSSYASLTETFSAVVVELASACAARNRLASGRHMTETLAHLCVMEPGGIDSPTKMLAGVKSAINRMG